MKTAILIWLIAVYSANCFVQTKGNAPPPYSITGTESARLKNVPIENCRDWMWFSYHELIFFTTTDNTNYHPTVKDIDTGAARSLRILHDYSFRMRVSPNSRWMLIKDHKPEENQIPWRAQEINGNKVVRWRLTTPYPDKYFDWNVWLPDSKGLLSVIRFDDHVQAYTFSLANAAPTGSYSFKVPIHKPVFAGAVNRPGGLTLYFYSTEEIFPGYGEHNVDWASVRLGAGGTEIKKWSMLLPDNLTRADASRCEVSPNGNRVALIATTSVDDPPHSGLEVERNHIPTAWTTAFWFGPLDGTRFTRLAQLTYPTPTRSGGPAYYTWSPDSTKFSFGLGDGIEMITVP